MASEAPRFCAGTGAKPRRGDSTSPHVRPLKAAPSASVSGEDCCISDL